MDPPRNKRTPPPTQLDYIPPILHHSINSDYLHMNRKDPDLVESRHLDEDCRYTSKMLGGASPVPDSHLGVLVWCRIPASLHPEF